MSQSAFGPAPPMTTIGTPARCAFATAVTTSVTPGPGGDRAHAGPPGHARVAVGGVAGGLLVAHVDDADALVEAAVVDGLDVAAAEREEVRRAVALERLGDEPAAVDHAHGGSQATVSRRPRST